MIVVEFETFTLQHVKGFIDTSVHLSYIFMGSVMIWKCINMIKKDVFQNQSELRW